MVKAIPGNPHPRIIPLAIYLRVSDTDLRFARSAETPRSDAASVLEAVEREQETKSRDWQISSCPLKIDSVVRNVKMLIVIVYRGY